ncbi:unnamed protein product, partial [Rotaria sordida]
MDHNLRSGETLSADHHSSLKRRNNEELASEETTISNSSRDYDNQMEFGIIQETSYSLRDHPRKAVCAFALFTIIAMTIGIITVCLGLPKET